MFPQPNEEELRKRYPWPPSVGGAAPDVPMPDAPAPPPPVAMPMPPNAPAAGAMASGPPAPSMHPTVDAPPPSVGDMSTPALPAREALTGPNVGNVVTNAPAAPVPPPVKAGTPEEDRLREMYRAGPKTSILGTLAGLGVKAAAGWASSPGRPAHVNEQRLQDWAERSPTGGSWREGIAQQGQLAGMEQADTVRAQAAAKAASDQAHVQAQIELAKKQGGYYDAHGEAVKQQQVTAAATEQDRLKNNQMGRIEQAGGAKRQVVNYPKGSPAPTGDWYKMADPYDDKMMIAVRASPGEEIEEELAKRLSIPKATDGKYYLTAAAARMGASDNTAGSAEAKRIADEADRKLRHNEANARIDESRANTALTRQRQAQAEADRQQAGRDRAQASIEKLQKEEQDWHAQRTQYGQRMGAKTGQTVIDPRTGGTIIITDQNGEAIRQAYKEKYDKATAEATRTHEAQRKLIERNGGGAGQPLDVTPSTPAVAPPPVTNNGGAGGGRGAPPPPAAAQGQPEIGKVVKLKDGRNVRVTAIDSQTGKISGNPVP